MPSSCTLTILIYFKMVKMVTFVIIVYFTSTKVVP